MRRSRGSSSARRRAGAARGRAGRSSSALSRQQTYAWALVHKDAYGGMWLGVERLFLFLPLALFLALFLRRVLELVVD